MKLTGVGKHPMSPAHNPGTPAVRRKTFTPGRSSRWQVFASRICDPASSGALRDVPFTVACMPTGIKSGVRNSWCASRKWPRAGSRRFEPRKPSDRATNSRHGKPGNHGEISNQQF